MPCLQTHSAFPTQSHEPNLWKFLSLLCSTQLTYCHPAVQTSRLKSPRYFQLHTKHTRTENNYRKIQSRCSWLVPTNRDEITWLTSRPAPVSCYCSGHAQISQALPQSSVGCTLAWRNVVMKFSFNHFTYFYASKKCLYLITHKSQYILPLYIFIPCIYYVLGTKLSLCNDSRFLCSWRCPLITNIETVVTAVKVSNGVSVMTVHVTTRL